VAEEVVAVTKVYGDRKVRVPKPVAEALGLEPGDRVVWVLRRGEVVLKKAKVEGERFELV